MTSQFLMMRIRQYFIEFSNNPCVVVSNPDSRNDYRKGRVFEINADGTIKVAFESGPGDVVASFERHELESVLDTANIKLPKKED